MLPIQNGGQRGINPLIQNGGQRGSIPLIQVKKARTEKEPRIYDIMMRKLRDHHRYFAPAEKVQAVSLKSLTKNSDLKSETEYVRVTRREIGSQTLEERIKDYTKKLPSSAPEKIEDYYDHIVHGLLKLKELHIVHFNIHPSNIIYSDSEYYPVITDFSQAFILEDLYNEDTMKSVFAKPHPPHRCMEAIFISAILAAEPTEWKTKKVSLAVLEEVLKERFLPEEEREKWEKYIQKLGNKKKEGKQVVDDLLRNWDTWDLYSVEGGFAPLRPP